MIASYIYSPVPGKKSWVKWSRPKRAFAFQNDQQIDLITGKINQNGVEYFNYLLAGHKVGSDPYGPTIIHFSYDGTHHFYIEYNHESRVDLPAQQMGQEDWELIQYPTWPEYQTAYEKVYEHLLRGDTYQVNLTGRFCFQSHKVWNKAERFLDIFSFPTRLAPFAHATIIPQIDFAFVSNTPECLAMRSKRMGVMPVIKALPIKGTIKLEGNPLSPQQRAQLFSKLSNDVKNRSELFMILDLLRNDLSAIGLPRAQITHAQLPMEVAGLLHQYGVVEKAVPGNTSWGQVLDRVFPGGSITGAPKKRTMEIIREVEQNPRGFYCGTTLALAPHLAKATINIRSVTWEKDILSYGAGGGITLLSKAREEYQEMWAKVESFFGGPINVNRPD